MIGAKRHNTYQKLTEGGCAFPLLRATSLQVTRTNAQLASRAQFYRIRKGGCPLMKSSVREL